MIRSVRLYHHYNQVFNILPRCNYNSISATFLLSSFGFNLFPLVHFIWCISMTFSISLHILDHPLLSPNGWHYMWVLGPLLHASNKIMNYFSGCSSSSFLARLLWRVHLAADDKLWFSFIAHPAGQIVTNCDKLIQNNETPKLFFFSIENFSFSLHTSWSLRSTNWSYIWYLG